MGTLATYLQHEFARKCPVGWNCHPERHLVPAALERLLGYAARADVLLEKQDGSRRLWVEFEVSRADPVANHAKFATSHLFQPQEASDSFVSMVSCHVNKGRRNLAANTILLMRHIGMKAFQTALLPSICAPDIKRLNHLELALLAKQGLEIEPEIERAIAISEVVMSITDHDIHLVGELVEVFLNLQRWNLELATEAGKRSWGRRTVTYFVFEPISHLFAPSKFCAYAAVPIAGKAMKAEPKVSTLGTMTIDKYVLISDGTHLLDGGRAQTHLTARLRMFSKSATEAPDVAEDFSAWLTRNADAIQVHPKGPIFLLSPSSYE